jgi:hypothetical protein
MRAVRVAARLRKALISQGAARHKAYRLDALAHKFIRFET